MEAIPRRDLPAGLTIRGRLYRCGMMTTDPVELCRELKLPLDAATTLTPAALERIRSGATSRADTIQVEISCAATQATRMIGGFANDLSALAPPRQ